MERLGRLSEHTHTHTHDKQVDAVINARAETTGPPRVHDGPMHTRARTTSSMGPSAVGSRIPPFTGRQLLFSCVPSAHQTHAVTLSSHSAPLVGTSLAHGHRQGSLTERPLQWYSSVHQPTAHKGVQPPRVHGTRQRRRRNTHCCIVPWRKGVNVGNGTMRE